MQLSGKNQSDKEPRVSYHRFFRWLCWSIHFSTSVSLLCGGSRDTTLQSREKHWWKNQSAGCVGWLVFSLVSPCSEEALGAGKHWWKGESTNTTDQGNYDMIPSSSEETAGKWLFISVSFPQVLELETLSRTAFFPIRRWPSDLICYLSVEEKIAIAWPTCGQRVAPLCWNVLPPFAS